MPRHSLVLSLAPSAWGYLSGPLRQLTRACGPRPTSHASSWQLFQRPTTRRMMTYALLSMSERHGLLAGIMCAGASPVPACAKLTQPPAWFFAAVARPCLWAVGVQLPPHLAASASCCVTRRSCCGGSLRRRRPACRGSLASELLSRRGPCRRPGRKSTTAGGTTAKMASCFLICRVFHETRGLTLLRSYHDVRLRSYRCSVPQIPESRASPQSAPHPICCPPPPRSLFG